MTIGDRLRALRKEKGFTQKELAQKLGVSPSMVGQYETNVRKPKFETLEKFATSLGVSITEIIDISAISPSLNTAAPLMFNLQKVFNRDTSDGGIILSQEDRNQIRQLSELISKIPEEMSNSSFLNDMLKREYLSVFDKLNLNGKYLAVKMVSDLLNDPDNSGCPLCNPKQESSQ